MNTASPRPLLTRMRAALRSAPALTAGREVGLPRPWWQHLARHGLLGLGFTAEGGSTQADAITVATLSGLIARETTSLGLALAWLMNELLGRFVIAAHLSEPARQTLLRQMARGEKIVALAISEPGVGAHPKHLSCRARLDGAHWQLDGDKAIVSNGPDADVFVVLAVSGEDGGRKRFDAYLVDADTPGLHRLPAQQPPLLPPQGHCGLQLQACRVPGTHRLETAGQAFEMIAKPLRAIEDSLLAGALAGAMQAELDALASWLRGSALTPARRRRLGALQLELAALSELATSAARRLDTLGPDEGLANLNVGILRGFERWQDNCESFAAQLDDHEPALLQLARDIHTVLGIARRVAEQRQLAAGDKLLQSKETDEIPA